MGDQLDIYTRNRLKLCPRTVKYPTLLVNRQLLAQLISILECMDEAHKQNKTYLTFQQGLFDKIDAYALTIKDNSISIVGKGTQMQSSMV